MPSPPRVATPKPPTARRAWGKIPYEERFRTQRRDLLAAAETLGAEHGIAGTSVAEIVRHAGVAKRAFYEHFADKEACFVELGRHISAQYLRSGITAAESATGMRAREALRATIVAFAEPLADPRLIHALRSEAPAGSALAAAWAAHHQAVAEIFVALAVRLGSPLPRDTLTLTAELIIHGVYSMSGDIATQRRRRPEALRTRSEALDELAIICSRAFALETRYRRRRTRAVV